MKKLIYNNKEYYFSDIFSYSYIEPSNGYVVYLTLISGSSVKLECKDRNDWLILLHKLGDNVL